MPRRSTSGVTEELQRAYPPETLPKFQLRRIVGGGDVWTLEAVGDYGRQTFHVVIIFEFRDGKILRETRCYPEPFEAPEWRAQWVQRMEPEAPPPSPPA